MKAKREPFIKVLLIIFLIAVFVFLYLNFQTFKRSTKLKTYEIMPSVVLSGSMKPVVFAGDMIFIKGIDAKEIKIGDIITYKKGKNLITHRVLNIKKTNEKLLFETKGDVNNIKDEYLVTEEQVVGKKIFRVRFLGYICYYISKNKNLFLVFIPLAIITGGETYYYLKRFRQRNNDNKGDAK